MFLQLPGMLKSHAIDARTMQSVDVRAVCGDFSIGENHTADYFTDGSFDILDFIYTG